eukprot:Pgem_evm1s449
MNTAGIDASNIKSNIQCEACIQANLKTKKVSKIVPHYYSNKAFGSFISTDVYGPQVPSLGNNKWGLMNVAPLSQGIAFCWTIPMVNKSDAADKFESWLNDTFQCGLQVTECHSDNGGEFTGNEFKSMLKRYQITPSYTSPNTPEHNLAERYIGLAKAMEKAMLIQADLPSKFWAEAMIAACNIVNYTSGAWELWFNRAPPLKSLYQFGAHVYFRIHQHGSISDNAEKGIMLGPATDTCGGAYRIYNPRTKRVIKSRSIRVIKKTNNTSDVNADSDDDVPGLESSSDSESEENNEENVESGSDSESEENNEENNEENVESGSDSESEENNEENIEESSNKDNSISPLREPLSQTNDITLRPITTRGTYRVNDQVIVQYKADWVPATVFKRHNNGKYNVKLHSGQYVNNVKTSRIKDNIPTFSGLNEDQQDETDPVLQDDQLTNTETTPGSENLDKEPTSPASESSIGSESRYTERRCYSVLTIPKSPHEALKDPKWRHSMFKELKALSDQNTWEITPRNRLPPKSTMDRTTWNFRIKDDGTLKSRVCLMGNRQVEGVNYFNSSSPVVSKDTMRVISAVVQTGKLSNLVTVQYDFSAAYANADMDVIINLIPPVGLAEYHGCPEADLLDNYYLLLLKALYGGKQCGALWHNHVRNWLISNGFHQLLNEPCVFTKQTKEEYTIFMLYVDDLRGYTNNPKACDDLFAKSKMKYTKVTSNKFNGIQYLDHGTDVFLHQQRYTNDLIDKYNLTDCKPVITPMTKDLPKQDSITFDCDYNGIVGSLQYLANGTRPDIATAVNKLSQHLTSYGKEHYTAALSVIKYLAGTTNLGLVAHRTQNITIEVYVDASYGSEYDRRSRTGILIIVNGCTTIWESRKQPVVALSSASSEYIALANCILYVQWLQTLLKQLFNLDIHVIINTDNKPSKHIAENINGSKLTRHTDIKYHFIKEVIANDNHKITLRYLNTNDQLADIMTKPLGGQKFSKFRDLP